MYTNLYMYVLTCGGHSDVEKYLCVSSILQAIQIAPQVGFPV